MKIAMMAIIMMMTMTMIMIEIIVINYNDNEGGNADDNNDGGCSHRGKSAERAMFKVRYSSLSMSLL